MTTACPDGHGECDGQFTEQVQPPEAATPRLGNEEIARLLDSAASALRHGRYQTATQKVATVNAQLNGNAHDGLVAALAALVKWMDDSGHSKTKAGGKGVIRYEGHEYQVVTQAREALKLARGE